MKKLKRININYLIIITILLFISLSCTKIRFWQNENDFSDILNKEKIEKQIIAISESDPLYDSFLSHLLFDNRLMSVTSMGLITPGISNLEIVDRLFTKNIWGTTDVGRNDLLYSVALLYAYRYNINLLEINNLRQFIRPFDEDELLL